MSKPGWRGRSSNSTPRPRCCASARSAAPRRPKPWTSLAQQRRERQDPAARKLLAQWPAMQQAYAGDEYVVKIRDKEIRTQLTHTTLSGNKIRKVVLPKYEDRRSNCSSG